MFKSLLFALTSTSLLALSSSNLFAQTGPTVIESGAKVQSVNTTGAQTIAGAKTFSSPLLNSAGSASLPSMSFSGDPNTGMYSYAADEIGIALNGAYNGRFSTDIMYYGKGGTGSNDAGVYLDSGSASGGEATLFFLKNAGPMGYIGSNVSEDVVKVVTYSNKEFQVDVNNNGILELAVNSTGIKLPTPGGTAATMTSYEEWTGTNTANTGASTVNPGVPLRATRIGRLVTVHAPANVTACTVSATNVTYGETLPSRFRPPAGIGTAVLITDNATASTSPGLLYIGSGGGVSIYKQLNASGLYTTGGVNCGLTEGANLTYYTNN